MGKCPVCGEAMTGDSDKCTSCSISLAEQQDSTTLNNIECPSCMATLESGTKKCSVCKYVISGEPSAVGDIDQFGTCANCGSLTPNGSSNCVICSAKVTDKQNDLIKGNGKIPAIPENPAAKSLYEPKSEESGDELEIGELLNGAPDELAWLGWYSRRLARDTKDLEALIKGIGICDIYLSSEKPSEPGAVKIYDSFKKARTNLGALGAKLDGLEANYKAVLVKMFADLEKSEKLEDLLKNYERVLIFSGCKTKDGELVDYEHNIKEVVAGQAYTNSKDNIKIDFLVETPFEGEQLLEAVFAVVTDEKEKRIIVKSFYGRGTYQDGKVTWRPEELFGSKGFVLDNKGDKPYPEALYLLKKKEGVN